MLPLLVTLALAGADQFVPDDHRAHCVRCAVDAQHHDDDGLNSPRVETDLDEDFILTSVAHVFVPMVTQLIPRAMQSAVDAPPTDSLFRPPRRSFV
jgi:hypothetical protein